MRRIFAFLLLVVALDCGGRDAATDAKSTPSSASVPEAPVSGRQTFVIVPQESKASYIADEEFFAGALKKLGIKAGKRKVIGTTQAIDGRFEFDPSHPTAAPGQNEFTVRVNTLSTDQDRRDKYIREDGPRFNDFPAATFRATNLTIPADAPRDDSLHLRLAGDMTIRNITKPVAFDVRIKMMGNTLRGTATTRLMMSDFGIEPLDFYNTLTVADEVGIELQVTARPPDPGARR